VARQEGRDEKERERERERERDESKERGTCELKIEESDHPAAALDPG
jgi:hypothetical protein